MERSTRQRVQRGPHRLRAGLIGLVGLVATTVLPATAGAAPPPDPLPWERTYVDPTPLSPEDAAAELWNTCSEANDLGFVESTSPGLRIGVLGDSTENLARHAALADPLHHWMYGTHCGERFTTAIESGRVASVLGADPDVLVISLGHNDLGDSFQFRPDYLPQAIANLHTFLDATDAVPCRVIHTLPVSAPFFWPAADQGQWPTTVGWLNFAMALEAAERPGLHVADWSTLVRADPTFYLTDGMHLTQAGINARINLSLATARQCRPPDSPTDLRAAPTSGAATLWWAPLPAAEAITGYDVELSDGRHLATTTNSSVVPGLTDGGTYQYRVSATNAAGTGEPSPWSAPFSPSGDGARFHPSPPVRVFDTRTALGGHPAAVGAGESVTVDLSSAVPPGASAVVLNVTATGQTSPTFVTVWPADRPRPVTSNLNPRPGIAAVPAMATTPVPADRTVRLYNNSGSVHLVVDVIGWYEAPGATTGSLYVPVAPVRLLDTREPTGAKHAPFGEAETFTLPVPGVPPGATAAVLNVTSTDTTRPGFVTVWPSGATRPLASNLNPQPGLTRANLTTVALGAGGAVDVFNNSASTHLVVDLIGWYGPAGAPTGGAVYHPVTPERHLDTRDGTGGLTGPVGGGAPTTLTLAGRGSIPSAGVTAVDANVTVVGATTGGHTTLWPSGPRPDASNLNFAPGEVVANRDQITLAGGTALVWSASPTIHYVVDVNGWFGPTT